jgi:hypothetical protein
MSVEALTSNGVSKTVSSWAGAADGGGSVWATSEAAKTAQAPATRRAGSARRESGRSDGKGRRT